LPRINCTPDAAEVTTIRCWGSRARSRSVRNDCAASQVCSARVARPSIAAGFAPRASRPIAYSQSELGRETRDAAGPRSTGSCPSGSQTPAGFGRTVSPKKSAAAMPASVTGMPLMTNACPTRDGSPPYCSTQRR
jgi:hypothetical protein